MSDEIRAGGTRSGQARLEPSRRVVPMKVGNATVYIEVVGEPLQLEPDDRIRPVAPPSPQEVFENAREILSECVRVIGERIETLEDQVRPKKISVEFSLTFEVKGTTSIIPVFFTGEAGAQTGLKVTAEWERTDSKNS